jgi:uncharacterized protein (TIRG00374 family)
VWWSIKDISLSAIGENLRQIGLQAILMLVVINMFIFVLFSFRWWTILRAQDLRVSLISVIGYRLAGFGVTYFTPGPQFGGEPLQVYLLKEKEGVATSPAATSVSIDKLLELLANFSFLLVGVTVLVFSGILNTGSRYVLILAPALLFAVPVIYLLALRTGRLPITFIFEKLGKILMHSKRYQGLLITLKETESLVSVFCRQNVKALLVGALLSLAIWALMVFEFGLMLQFLGVQFNLVQILVALTAARIAFLLPFPAGLGTLEAGQVMAMGLIGVSPAIGISLALLIRARDVLFGGAGLWLGGYYNR